MRFSGAASVGLAAILLVSLLGKLIAARPDPSPDAGTVATELATLFNEAGLEVRIVRTRRAPGILVEANGSDCRIVAGDYPPYDTYADVYRLLARPIGSLRYAYRGVLEPRPPKIRALLDFYLWREFRRVGLSRLRAPVIAMAATPGCSLQTINWKGVATVAR